LCMVAAHSDCCFFAPCTSILTYLLTVSVVTGHQLRAIQTTTENVSVQD